MPNDNSNQSSAQPRRQDLLKASSVSILKSRYPTMTDFQRAYAAVNIQAVALAPEKCFLSEDSPALSVMKATYGNQSPTAWLLSILSQWQEQIPVQGKMTVMQLHLLADNIAREFFFLKASEILLFLARLTGGAYNIQWFGQLNPDVILQTLRTRFMTDRAEALYLADIQRRESKPKSEPITWEEHCRRHGKSTENPFDRISFDK